MNKPNKDLPSDVFPEQVMEDIDGNMHVIPAEWLWTGGGDPQPENELGVENMENDLPCADVEDYGGNQEPDEQDTEPRR